VILQQQRGRDEGMKVCESLTGKTRKKKKKGTLSSFLILRTIVRFLAVR
jgi:hypothetical protein